MPIKQESKERQRQSNKPKNKKKKNSELVDLGWGQDFFWLCSTDNTE